MKGMTQASHFNALLSLCLLALQTKSTTRGELNRNVWLP